MLKVVFIIFLENLLTLENGVDENDTNKTQEDKVNILTPEQLNHLKAQVSVYKMLARNEPISKSFLNQVCGKNTNDVLPTAYEYPTDLDNGEKLPYDLVKVLSTHQQRSNNCGTSSIPSSSFCVDPQIILKERENRFFFF